MKFSTILIGLVWWLAASIAIPAHAEPARLTIVDSQGKPLPNAVVFVADDKVLADKRIMPRTAMVDQVNRQFKPFMTVVRKGSNITFPNSDNIRHHIYSFSDPKPFEIKLYANEERPTLDFDKPGLVTLGCNIHDQMIAHIVITDQRSAWVSDAEGEVQLPLVKAGDNVEVTVWHPWLGTDLSQAEIHPLTGTQQTITLAVSAPKQQEQPKSRLENRFNRTGTP